MKWVPLSLTIIRRSPRLAITPLSSLATRSRSSVGDEG